MEMEGDGPEGQPAEGVMTLDGLADGLDGGDAPEESAEDEAAEESEEVEDEGGEPEAEDDSEEEGEADDPTVKLKHDGKEIEVPLSEALTLAQQGYDYTQKTMAVAERRKAVDAEYEQAEAGRKAIEQANTEAIARLESYTKAIEKQVGQPPSVEILSTHGADVYLAQKEQYEARKGQLQEAYAAIQALQQETARQRQAAIEQKAGATEKVLRDTLPGWNDDTLKALSDYAGTLGLNPKSAEAAMLEPGFWQLAHKAKAYDALMDEKSKLKPVNKLPKVSKPQATNQPPQLARRQEAVKRHKDNPSLKTLADLL